MIDMYMLDFEARVCKKLLHFHP